MRDPYQILGVSSSATDDEIKKAYRSLCKKYHPDLNPNDPVAEEKFKEVQSAYDQVMKIRQGGYNPYAGGGSSAYGGHQQQYGYQDPFGFEGSGFRFYGPFGFGFNFGGTDYGSYSAGGYSQSSAQDETNEMKAARNYINAGHYREAMNVLNSVPSQGRTARWYYYSALANLGLGNSIAAMESARTAVSMEPDNQEYQQLLSRLQNQGQAYRTQSHTYGRPGFGIGQLCLAYWLCNCLCGGGAMPYIFCC